MEALDRCHAAFARAYSDSLEDVHGPDLAVACASGVGAGDDDVQDVIGLLVSGEHFHPDLGQEVYVVFGATVDLCVAALPAITAGRADRQSLDSVGLQAFPDGLELLRADDGHHPLLALAHQVLFGGQRRVA